MNRPDFDEWTRVERANWKRGRRRARWLRRAMVVSGVALIIFAVGVTLAGLTPPSIGGASEEVSAAPADETLSLTVPKMRRVSDLPVYTAEADNTAALDAGAIHVRGTGFPWESESNVYIAGHRLGYPNTGSFLVFYDLNRLAKGDEVLLTDSDGTRYVYRVFREIIVAPDEVEVTEPVAGRKIVSLQACTLPDYSRRLIVQAELVRVQEGQPEEPPTERAERG